MRATDITAALDALAARLESAGVSAAVDPTRVPVPGAWVTVDTLTPELLNGEFTGTAAIYLVARDGGHTTAVAALGDMLDRVAGACPQLGAAVPDSVALPGSGAPLPAFRTTTVLGD